jgi:hypothetical protein
MWKQTLQQGRQLPVPHADFIAAEAVATTPLSFYEEVAS